MGRCTVARGERHLTGALIFMIAYASLQLRPHGHVVPKFMQLEIDIIQF